MKCRVCGKIFTGLTPAGNIPGHSESGKMCAGSYQPPEHVRGRQWASFMDWYCR